jgi:glutamate dehydrogenase (NAD(P)+)
MQAFGRRLRPFLLSNFVAVGPDMGVTVQDVAHVYEGAKVENARSGLFARIVEDDPAAYHITGYGVATSMRAALATAGVEMKGARVAIEGFGQVGDGSARYAHRFGAKVVSISTLKGAIYNADGLDVDRLLQLRRTDGDDCVLAYGDAELIPVSSLYFLPVDVLVPGARPYVIDDENWRSLNARAIVSGGNITLTSGAYESLFQKGVLVVPDFISNAGAAIASWVDFLAGDFSQALATIDRLVSRVTTDVMQEASRTARNPYVVATDRVKERIRDARGQRQKSFDEIKVEIRQLFGM